MGTEEEKHVDPTPKEQEDGESDHGGLQEVDVGDDPFSKPAPKVEEPEETAEQPATAAAEPEPEQEQDKGVSVHAMMPPAVYEEDDVAPAQPQPQPSSSAPPAAPPSSGDKTVLGGELGVVSQFTFRVCDPRMTMPDSAMDLAYWIYTVDVSADAPGWESASKQPRRYSDFLWLRDQLCLEYPGTIVPPLPEKNVKGQLEKIMLTNIDLLSYRQRFLTRFLAAVGVHHLCKASPHLKAFCQLPAAEWDVHKANAKREVQEAAPTGMNSLMQKSKESWFKVFKKKTPGTAAADVAGASDGGDPETHRILEERKAYARDMEETLTHTQDRVKKHTETRTEISKSMAELSTFLTSTGELESRADAALGKDLKNSGDYTVKLSRLQQEQASREVLDVQEVLSFYIGLYRGIRDEIARLQKMQTTVAFRADELNSAEAAAMKAVGEKKAKAEASRDQASQCHKSHLEKYKDALKLFHSEWSKFHAIKERDFRNLQIAFADIQLSYGKQQETLDHAPIQPAVF
eukprot:TRINITY_DN74165_c0_g1_i1.p2 TRINITY_DN74165_c0_g1~~TRINITY_DN74165_c0_g1_i1.p2  ORF type:complete len:517 (+),score=228.62 TRINITY_DN74165_c0_g1_i1:61-1611(+)